MKPKLIIFDFSKTLAYFKKSDPEEFFSGMARLGMVVKTEEEMKSFGDLFGRLMSQSEDIKDFSEKMLDAFSVEKEVGIVEKAVEFFRDSVRYELYDDAKEILGLPVKKAILSSASDFLIKQSFSEGFEIFGSKTSEFQKPDSRAFSTVLESLGIKPEDAVMVGDEAERDLAGAQRLGIKTVLIDRKNELPDHSGTRINSLAELKSIFEL